MKDAWKAAVRSDDPDALDRLLAAGYDVDAKDEHGQTALMVAARDGRTAVAHRLIANGADLNHRAKFNLTALMLAVINCRVAIVQALVDAGADLTVRGSGAPGFHERTALDLAVVRGDGAFADQLADIAHILRAAHGRPTHG